MPGFAAAGSTGDVERELFHAVSADVHGTGPGFRPAGAGGRRARRGAGLGRGASAVRAAASGAERGC